MKNLLTSAILFVLSIVAHAQTQAPAGYLTKHVTIVVPFAPGGGSDAMARLIATRLSERTKAAFLVDNKPGAGTNVGNEFVVKAAPDGYTLLLGQVTLAINPTLYKGLRYNVAKDLAPVAHIANSPTVLVVNNALKANNVSEFISYVKANPGRLNYGSGGQGTSVHLAGELFKSVTNTFMVHIAYRGSGPAVVDLIGGQIQAIFDTAPSATPQVKNGRVKAIAVSGKTRLPELPNVPTFEEAGLSGFDAPAWYGIMAPAGTPAPVIEFLNAEVDQILKEPAVLSRLAALGSIAAGGPASRFASFIKAESSRWEAVIKRNNITAE